MSHLLKLESALANVVCCAGAEEDDGEGVKQRVEEEEELVDAVVMGLWIASSK